MSKRKQYEGYFVEDFLLDQEFVLEVRTRSSEAWDEFLSTHAYCKQSMLEAKRIIGLFDVKDELPLDALRKARLWEQIHNYNQSTKATLRKMYLYRSVAAAVMLAVVLAAGLYLRESRNNQWYFESTDASGKPELAKSTLILSDGNQVALENKRSSLTVLDSAKAIRIDGDQIVSVKEQERKKTRKEELNKVIVPYGDETSLQLADGTKVWLNAGSRIAFPTEFENTRKVHLEGEAYFEVSKDSDRPFIVSTHDIDVKVYGTKFNVSAYRNDDYTEAVLLEGSISLVENKSVFKIETYMAPGQKATYARKTKDISLEKTKTPELYTSWREGWYQFSDVDLTYVTHKLERFYNVQFEFDDDVISNSSRVSGKLELKKSLDEVLTVLAKVSKTEYQRLGDKVILSIPE